MRRKWTDFNQANFYLGEIYLQCLDYINTKLTTKEISGSKQSKTSQTFDRKLDV